MNVLLTSHIYECDKCCCEKGLKSLLGLLILAFYLSAACALFPVSSAYASDYSNHTETSSEGAEKADSQSSYEESEESASSQASLAVDDHSELAESDKEQLSPGYGEAKPLMLSQTAIVVLIIICIAAVICLFLFLLHKQSNNIKKMHSMFR